MNRPTIAIEFNGKSIEVPEGSTIANLLKLAEMRSQLIAVEVNLHLVPRERHAEFLISDGDCIEAVTLVGGG